MPKALHAWVDHAQLGDNLQEGDLLPARVSAQVAEALALACFDLALLLGH